MGAGAGIRVILWVFNYRCADGVLFDVSGDGPEIRFLINDTRVVSALPKSSGASILSVHVLAITESYSLHHFLERPFQRWYYNEMHMIGHETVAGDGSAPFLRISFQQEKIHCPVFVIKEYLFPIVASLDNVMRKARRYRPRYSWHKSSLHEKIPGVKKNGMCPYFEYLPLATRCFSASGNTNCTLSRTPSFSTVMASSHLPSLWRVSPFTT